MALFVLDTDAIIDYLNNFDATVHLIDGLFRRGEELATCATVVTEVHSGLDPENETAAAGFLAALEFLPASIEIARQAGRWRYQYRRRGIQLGVADVTIAATASHFNATLVTGNLRHFPMAELSILPLPR